MWSSPDVWDTLYFYSVCVIRNYDECITVNLLFSVYLTVSLYFYEIKVFMDHMSLHRGEGGSKKNSRMFKDVGMALA